MGNGCIVIPGELDLVPEHLPEPDGQDVGGWKREERVEVKPCVSDKKLTSFGGFSGSSCKQYAASATFPEMELEEGKEEYFLGSTFLPPLAREGNGVERR